MCERERERAEKDEEERGSSRKLMRVILIRMFGGGVGWASLLRGHDIVIEDLLLRFFLLLRRRRNERMVGVDRKRRGMVLLLIFFLDHLGDDCIGEGLSRMMRVELFVVVIGGSVKWWMPPRELDGCPTVVGGDPEHLPKIVVLPPEPLGFDGTHEGVVGERAVASADIATAGGVPEPGTIVDDGHRLAPLFGGVLLLVIVGRLWMAWGWLEWVLEAKRARWGLGGGWGELGEEGLLGFELVGLVEVGFFPREFSDGLLDEDR